MRLRVRLAKLGSARFCSHLDLLNTLERSLRRAGLPLAYTNGFSRRPKFSFAGALATGVSSEGEFVDIDLAHEVDPAWFTVQANRHFPEGFAILEARAVDPKAPTLSASINAADYRLEVTGVGLQEAVDSFLAQEQVTVMRDGKHGPVSMDIRSQVYRLTAEDGALRTIVAFGVAGAPRPEQLVTALGLAAESLSGVHRLMLYQRDPDTGALTSP